MNSKYYDSDSSKQSRPMTKQELNMQYGKAVQIHEIIEGPRMQALMETLVRWKFEKKPQIAKVTDNHNNLIGYVITADDDSMKDIAETFANSEHLSSEGFNIPEITLKKVGDL